jgi:hypothetical protein
MYHFETMPDNAKVWVYAANRLLTVEEHAQISAKGNLFVNKWTSHQQKLTASFDILHDTFIVIMVNEDVNPVGGCGTDDSVHFIKSLEQEFGIGLFDRLQVELMKDGQVIITSRSAALSLYEEGAITEETVFFNKNLTRKKEFDECFRIPFSQSWSFSRYKKEAHSL